MKLLKKFADNSSHDSLANKFRRKRLKIFISLTQNFPKPISVLDVGGTFNYWQQMDLNNYPDFQITILNTELESIESSNITFVAGDAADLSRYSNFEFDVVHSNSVIEHLPNFELQNKMASEIIRVGKSHFVQTPNYYFPIEPHFLFPFFQFLPSKLKVFLLSHFNLGWYKKTHNYQSALELSKSIRLLKPPELQILFPNSIIVNERFFLLKKSLISIENRYL